MRGCLRTISMTNSLLKVRLTSARTSEEMDGALKIVLVIFLVVSLFTCMYIDHFYQIDALLGAKIPGIFAETRYFLFKIYEITFHCTSMVRALPWHVFGF